jgi:aspartyl-tRNA(Asn)/glutamyl-tRNA(Gln) amidotransferase subunit A
MLKLTQLTLKQLRNGLDKREFSAKDLIQVTLAAISEKSDLNAFITVCDDEALAAAAEADRKIKRGESTPLLGIPVGVEDRIMTKGIRTTCGSKLLRSFIPPYDATVVRRLLEAGAIIIGKSNLDEFSMGSSGENSAFGVVKNPWNKSCVAGGSSGGAAVAAQLVPAVVATDTGGGLRQAAAFCGVYGLRPTYGRISRYGVAAFASSLDQVGVLSKRVEDLGIITTLIAGYDSRDATSMDVKVPEFSPPFDCGLDGVTIGVPQEYFSSLVESEVLEKVKVAINRFEELGAKVVYLKLEHTTSALSAYYVISSAEGASNLSRFDGVRYGERVAGSDLEEMYLKTRSEGFGSEVKRRILFGTYVLSKECRSRYYLQAQKMRRLVLDDFKKAFTQCDLLITPVTPSGVFKIGQKTSDPLSMYLNDAFTAPVSLAGLPALGIPCGVDSAKLPIGMQLIADYWCEELLLKVAATYQKVMDVWGGGGKGTK